MSKDHSPRPGDSPETALEKSGSMDERVPGGPDAPAPSDAVLADTRAPLLPESGTHLRVDQPLGEGEAALELERKGQRARGEIQRG